MKRLVRLASFIKALRRHGIELDLTERRDRFRLHKYVYLARWLADLDLGYEFDMYLYGPYSPQLGRDIVELMKMEAK